MNISTYIAIVLLIGVCMGGCRSRDDVFQPPPPKNTAHAKKIEPSSFAVGTEEKLTRVYHYQSANARDPFTPLVRTIKLAPIGESAPLEPLESYEIDQLKVIAILLGFESPRAMISTPDGKSYIVTLGNRAGKNRGVITNITNKYVSIKESYYDYQGNVTTGLKELAVHRQEAK